MVGGVRADREWQSMTINNSHDFHAFSAPRWPNLCPAPLRHHKRGVNETFFFIQLASVAKLVGYIRQHPAQNVIAAPSLKAPMYRFVVRIALRKHVPLRTCVENPQDRLKHPTARDRFTSRTTIGNMLFWKMFPNAFPLLPIQACYPSIWRRA